MILYYELDLNHFDAWSGAENTLARVQDHEMIEDLEALLNDLYPDGLTETELNDILRFEPDYIYNMLGIKTEAELDEEIEELQEQIKELEEEQEDADEDEQEELQEQIEELKEQIEELREEF